MSDLFRSLTSATRAMDAQRFGLDVTGHNIANVNTPGYTRRVADFAAAPPEHQWSAGRGVDVVGIHAQRDRLIDRRLEQEITAEAREGAIASSLGVVEARLGASGRSIDARLTDFFNSFARLADDPLSAVARQEVLLQANALTAAFRSTAEGFAEARRSADLRIVGAVDEINELARGIAAINDSIAALGSGRPEGALHHLRDQRSVLVRQLTELADVGILEREDGLIDISLAGGRALVVGDNTYAVSTAPTGPNGLSVISLNGADVTGDITGGEIGGLLVVRDVHLPTYQQRLDEQAFALAGAVNTVHAAGFDPAGNTGQDFFAFSAPPVGVAGAAAALTVDAVVAADGNRIAAAGINVAADNQAARALSAVRDTRVLDGGRATLTDSWSQLVYRIGRDVQAASHEQGIRREVVNSVETLRDQVSGVSLDEEATQLMKFQRAYEANARFFRVIDQTLDLLFATLVR